MANRSSPTRTARPGRKKSSRRGLIIMVVVIGPIIGLGVYLLLGLTEGSTGPTYSASESINLAAGPTAMNTVSFAGGTFSLDVSAAVMTTLGEYAESAMVTPLRKGKPASAALANIFDAPALARLSGPDRTVVLDEGLPRAVGKIDVSSPPIPLTGLADASGNTILVSADVKLTAKARTEKGVIGVTRVGTFVLAPDTSGIWKITGWTLTTDRRGPGTSVAPTTTGAKESSGK
ncbi:MAG: hypothetical protein F2861_09025 [Actinobacteria bacterium]|nr:hypothetical protein [Actinomycetota bacterium]